jgi:hypothetical protein
VAEIKSTLELAMERTKKITISEEDREEIKQKETLEKVNVLFHRYGEGHLPLNEILREIERMDQKMRTMVKEVLLSRWIEALSLSDKEESLFKGIESLKQRSIDDIKRKFHHLLTEYQQEKKKIKQAERDQLEEVLRREGIFGSAVEPNIERSEIWKKESEKLDHSYTMKLEEIKEHLRSL